MKVLSLFACSCHNKHDLMHEWGLRASLWERIIWLQKTLNIQLKIYGLLLWSIYGALLSILEPDSLWSLHAFIVYKSTIWNDMMTSKMMTELYSFRLRLSFDTIHVVPLKFPHNVSSVWYLLKRHCITHGLHLQEIMDDSSNINNQSLSSWFFSKSWYSTINI